ncbi:MAG: hypothetical protein ABEK36_03105 [Candidatus Aenigmatarchaeota archaeon]
MVDCFRMRERGQMTNRWPFYVAVVLLIVFFILFLLNFFAKIPVTSGVKLLSDVFA